MAWAALARKNITAAPAAKILERHADADGSMYAAVASVLNDSLHVLISVAVLCPRTGRLLLVRDPEAASSRGVATEGDEDALPEFDPNDARAAAAALQLWSRSSLYLVETSLDCADQSVADAARAACRAQAGIVDVHLRGIVCIESYLQGLRRNFLRITVVASAEAPLDGCASAASGARTDSAELPHVWLDAELCLQPECKLLRSQDFCPYLVAHMHDAYVWARRACVRTFQNTVSRSRTHFSPIHLGTRPLTDPPLPSRHRRPWCASPTRSHCRRTSRIAHSVLSACACASPLCTARVRSCLSCDRLTPRDRHQRRGHCPRRTKTCAAVKLSALRPSVCV